jgi:hypothetical protein
MCWYALECLEHRWTTFAVAAQPQPCGSRFSRLRDRELVQGCPGASSHARMVREEMLVPRWSIGWRRFSAGHGHRIAERGGAQTRYTSQRGACVSCCRCGHTAILHPLNSQFRIDVRWWGISLNQSTRGGPVRLITRSRCRLHSRLTRVRPELVLGRTAHASGKRPLTAPTFGPRSLVADLTKMNRVARSRVSQIVQPIQNAIGMHCS